jgi:phosphatidylglycerol---prolipoprotein diacylglyceryl transferase
MTSLFAAINFTPDPVAFHLGPIPIYWYGIMYAIGLALVYRVLIGEAKRRGFDTRHVDNGIVLVAVAALIGGRLYHVIDQWQLYRNDPITAFLPVTRAPDGSLQFAGISGLGVYGGIFTGTLAGWAYTRWQHLPFWRWADVVAPALFVMQAVGRWGNFFNQELYGPPTNLPWGIAIDCAHRIAAYPCSQFPFESTAFQPLFLYESVSGVVGFVTLRWVGRRFGDRLRPGDLFLLFVIWYGVVRFALEFLRADNWTIGGVPTAQIVSGISIVAAVGALLYRHRPGAAELDDDEYEYEDEYEDDDAYDEGDEDEEEDEDPGHVLPDVPRPRAPDDVPVARERPDPAT